MKTISVLSVIAVLAVAVAVAQQFDKGRDGRRPPRPPRDQVFQLFDIDDNEEISQDEMENATAILKGRDRNGDGVLTREELPRPPRPENERRSDPDRHDGPRPPAGQRYRDRATPDLKDAPVGAVFLSGGYETDPRDHGRPVALIAAALGVKPEVFREAFSRVRPARGGPPTAERVRANKQVLMEALGKYGITNDRLDEVSNYYRYQPEAGETWPHRAAHAKAIIKDGQVASIEIADPGHGYMTAPKVSIAGYRDIEVQAEIEFSKDFATNGRVTKLTIVDNAAR